MRVVEVPAVGGPEVLRMSRRPDPEIGDVPGRVRVRLKAAGVNQADLRIRSGGFAPGDVSPPFVLGIDFAGTLLDPAPGLPEGTRVAGFIPWGREGTGQGSYAEMILAEPDWLAPVPDDVDFTTAASVPVSSLVAAQAVDLLDLPPGSSVLITGAGGVVGWFAVQHAVAAGHRVVALGGDESDLRHIGAEAVIPRGAPEDVITAVLGFAPERVDGVIDTALIGDPLLPAVRDGGVFVPATVERMPTAERGIRVVVVEAEPDSARLKRMLEQVAARELATRMADVLPLEEAAEAHRRAEAGHRPGRIVLMI
ncbi:NADP-dependent oxidoreductase [Streptomyces sp. NPDC020807]|uniref:NADP-dependent oxidoreductase n=1 Tax=Streptomyces sp. NPDC020807 TaxID=3155119 RepID=UPI0033F9CA5F